MGQRPAGSGSGSGERRQAHLSARESTGSARISVGANLPIHGDNEATPLLNILSARG